MRAEAETDTKLRTEPSAYANKQRKAEASLKRKMIAFFQGVEREMHAVCRQHLVHQIENSRFAGQLACLKETQPLTSDQQATVWAGTRQTFADFIAEHLLCLAHDQLSLMDATCDPFQEAPALLDRLRTIEDIFCLEEWNEDCREHIQEAIRVTIQRAAAAGLKQIAAMV